MEFIVAGTAIIVALITWAAGLHYIRYKHQLDNRAANKLLSEEFDEVIRKDGSKHTKTKKVYQ
jgi:hypothetical protein